MLAATRGTRVATEVDLGRGAFPRERVAPVTAQDVGEPLEIVLLDQEVRLRPSTLAAARWAADECGNVFGEAAIAEGFHLGDRAGHGGNQRQAAQHLFGVVELHPANCKDGMTAGCW